MAWRGVSAATVLDLSSMLRASVRTTGLPPRPLLEDVMTGRTNIELGSSTEGLPVRPQSTIGCEWSGSRAAGTPAAGRPMTGHRGHRSLLIVSRP